MSSASVQKRGSASTVRACDSCRKRKRRCLWNDGQNSCTQCIQLKERCTTTYIRKQRSKLQRRERVEEYERRIQSLENLLKDRSDAQPKIPVQPLPPLPEDDPVSLSMWVNSLRAEVDQFPLEDSLLDLDPTTYGGPFQATGLASSISGASNSIASVEPSEESVLQSFGALEPSADFEEDAALLHDLSFQPLNRMGNLNLDDSIIIPITTCNKSLPDPELGASLLAEFLVDFNTVYALYRPNDIAEHIRICYEGHSDGTALAWASAYVVLGIAHRARAMSNVGTPMDNELADYYMSRILPTVSGLLIAPPTLGLVQCLLGVAMLIRSSSHSQPTGIFISTALRIAQFLAYDNREDQPERDFEQERRVFWCAFTLDTIESIFSNAPTTHLKEDLYTSFPNQNPPDRLGFVIAAEGNWKVNLFSLHVCLALHGSKTIDRVLSARASASELDRAAQEVLQNLRAWRDNDLFRLAPSAMMQVLYRSDFMHVLTVEASYFATVFRIHAFLTLGKNPLVNPFSADVLAILASRKELGAYEEAERLLTHLALIPHGDIGVCWMIKLPLIAAFITVLSNRVNKPPEAYSVEPMHSYRRILNTLQIMAEKSQDLELLRARDVCRAIFLKAETNTQAKSVEEQNAGSTAASSAAQSAA